MIPFAARIIIIPAVALAAAIVAALYFRPTDKPAAVATAPAIEPGQQQPLPAPGPQTALLQPPAATPPAAAVAPSAPPSAGPKPPQFDIVRVSPSGETVVAGRAPGGSRVELLDAGKVIAGDKVQPSGEFVLLPPALAAGDHSLALRVIPEGQPPVSSAQSVVVGVRPGTSPIVTLAEPGKPSVVLAAPASVPAEQKPAQAATAPAAGQVTIKTAEVEAGGRFFATGTAAPGSTVRLYLNGSHLADAGAAADGNWSLTIGKGVTGGKYALRADAVGPQGKVVSRAEVPFEAPMVIAGGPAPSLPGPLKPFIASPPATIPPGPSQPTASPPQQVAGLNGSEPPRAAPSASAEQPATAKPSPPPSTSGSAPVATASPTSAASQSQTGSSVAANNSAANPIIPEISTATVSRGDSLWKISRLRWGKGIRYTVIYEANASQIRNPALIYPGQVLVMPQN